MVATELPSLLARRRTNRPRHARRPGPRLLYREELRAHRLPPHGGQSAGRSSGSPSHRPVLPGGGAIRSPR
jgi:hypothetical protein